jgi:hypothetical protein
MDLRWEEVMKTNMEMSRIAEAAFPNAPGVYVVWGHESGDRPLYVGKAGTQTLRRRWVGQHLRPRAGGSALRRTLGVHLGLVDEKLRRPDRYYPRGVEEAIGEFLLKCPIEFFPTTSAEEASTKETELIRRLGPVLNVTR